MSSFHLPNLTGCVSAPKQKCSHIKKWYLGTVRGSDKYHNWPSHAALHYPDTRRGGRMKEQTGTRMLPLSWHSNSVCSHSKVLTVAQVLGCYSKLYCLPAFRCLPVKLGTASASDQIISMTAGMLWTVDINRFCRLLSFALLWKTPLGSSDLEGAAISHTYLQAPWSLWCWKAYRSWSLWDGNLTQR